MASNTKKEEPSTAPQPDRWYNLTLGSSFKDHHPSSKFCTLRYEFKPASIDKNQAGSLHKNKDNRVSVEFHNNQPGKPKVTFEGSSEDYKDNDAVLFFDGQTFRLERLHRAVKRLRHVRLPGESAAAAATSLGPAAESGSPPVSKVAKFQSLNKSIPLSMPYITRKTNMTLSTAKMTSGDFLRGVLPTRDILSTDEELGEVTSSRMALTTEISVEIERIEIGNFKNLDTKPQNGKEVGYPSADPLPSTASPDLKSDEQVDIVNDGDEVDESGNGSNNAEKEFHTGIDINLPHQNDSDEEIADVDVNDDEDKGCNAAEALRAQVNAEERRGQTSSSSDSSGSDSSGSGSGSSSSDTESSDGDSVNSI